MDNRDVMNWIVFGNQIAQSWIRPQQQSVMSSVVGTDFRTPNTTAVGAAGAGVLIVALIVVGAVLVARS